MSENLKDFVEPITVTLPAESWEWLLACVLDYCGNTVSDGPAADAASEIIYQLSSPKNLHKDGFNRKRFDDICTNFSIYGEYATEDLLNLLTSRLRTAGFL